MTLSLALATRINELIKKKKITQYRLSMNSGVPAPYISEIRHCKNKTTALYIVYDIAQGFDMTLQEFFDSPLFSYENITD